MSQNADSAVVFAGVPAKNNALYHQLRFAVGDPAACITLPTGKRVMMVRDIEMQRARKHAAVDEVCCPADFTPAGGLSGDRETATAQALAELIVRQGVTSVVADRSLPLIYWHAMRERSIDVCCDLDLGVTQRRAKDDQEISWLADAQQVTEQAIELACRLIASAPAAADGGLMHEGAPLTAERVRQAIDVFLLGQGYANSASIVAGGPEGADCHNAGTGALYAEQPVIVDIFPQNRATKYHGDCTRTVVNGEVPPTLKEMHAAVVAAKEAATAACKAGATGESVHAESARVMIERGFQMGLPDDDASEDTIAMVHGTGHGIGLDVHEPPLLDKGGPGLIIGDALTIEPGLYNAAIGGVRVEDMVIVEEGGCRNLNELHEGLDWT